MTPDPYDLDRFVHAQVGVFDMAMAELRAGRKRSHWMWFVFPPLRGLGSSTMAERYGIGSIDEARAYFAHPLLGQRLHEAVAVVMESRAASLRALLGTPDDLKFCSSMTLFDRVEPTGVFAQAVVQWCDGPDPRTVAMLRA